MNPENKGSTGKYQAVRAFLRKTNLEPTVKGKTTGRTVNTLNMVIVPSIKAKKSKKRRTSRPKLTNKQSVVVYPTPSTYMKEPMMVPADKATMLEY